MGLGRRELWPLAVLLLASMVRPMTVDGYLTALSAAAVTAVAAVAVALVFRCDGYVSFAIFALAVLAATAAGSGPVLVLAPICVGLCGLVGWVSHRAVSLLRGRPRVVPTLVGMLVLQLLFALRGLLPAHGWPARSDRPTTATVCVLAAVATVVVLLRLRKARPGTICLGAGILCGLAGVLAAELFAAGPGPLSGASTLDFPVDAMATVLVAAAAGGFTDLGTIVFAALALNVAEQSIIQAWGDADLYRLILLPLLAAALLLRRRHGAAADVTTPRLAIRLPRVPAWALVLAGVCVPALAVAAYRFPVLTELVGFSLVGLSLMMLMGWVGQVTLGQLGFAALGGWVALASGLPYPLAMLAGAVVGAVLSPLVALSAIRHGGAPAPVTSLTWGVFAFTLFTSPHLLGWSRVLAPQRELLTTQARGSWVVLVALAFVGCFGSVALVHRSRFGRVLAAARLDGAVAAEAGMDLPRARLAALVLTGFVASTGGTVLALAHGGVLAGAYATETGVRLVSATGVGGMQSVAGPVAGVAIFGLVIASFALPGLRFAVNGVAGLVTLAFDRDGVAGLGERLRRAFRALPRAENPPLGEAVR